MEDSEIFACRLCAQALGPEFAVWSDESRRYPSPAARAGVPNARYEDWVRAHVLRCHPDAGDDSVARMRGNSLVLSLHLDLRCAWCVNEVAHGVEHPVGEGCNYFTDWHILREHARLAADFPVGVETDPRLAERRRQSSRAGLGRPASPGRGRPSARKGGRGRAR